ncbi:ligase-associated DNA damage response endonuclease PdeM [Albibacterium profundi]|uniref:Ligase-associated DNA damage response endonuclease PdeM n=1 Tax=Albibacterium profundi TaxID=3134906 RepID=A0ABV5CHU7_9SPHI
MNIHEKRIIFAGEELILNNQRTVYWSRKNMLILSDFHLGKPAYFRENGIAIPKSVAMKDIKTLESLLIYYGAEQVIIVGDLVHAGTNKELTLFKALVQKFREVRFLLIKGNHDSISSSQLEALGISNVHNELQIDPVSFSHNSRPGSKKHWIVGHIHPGIRIEMPTKRFIRLPCFVQATSELILPAFSRFTGLDMFRHADKKASYFAFYEQGIFMIEHFSGLDVKG